MPVRCRCGAYHVARPCGRINPFCVVVRVGLLRQHLPGRAEGRDAYTVRTIRSVRTGCSGRSICAVCARRTRTRFLREASGAQLPVRIDAHGRTRIFNACPIDRVGDLGALAAAGLTDALVDASLLDEAETDAVLDRVAEVRA